MPISNGCKNLAILKFTERVHVISFEVRVSVVFKCSIHFVFVNDNLKNLVLKSSGFLSRQKFLLGKNFRLSELCLNYPNVLSPRHLIPIKLLPQFDACKPKKMLTAEIRVGRRTLQQVVGLINELLKMVEVGSVKEVLVLNEILDLVVVVFVERLLLQLTEI
jgi:hypothetical protein